MINTKLLKPLSVPPIQLATIRQRSRDYYGIVAG
jgi:hypothetical protein